jgi:CYTH domain-containing protein
VGLFNLLWPHVGPNVVRKKRYLLDHDDRIFEVDVYHGKHEGLITLECEFQTNEEVAGFKLPALMGPTIDVTDDPRFKNKELSRSGKTPTL